MKQLTLAILVFIAVTAPKDAYAFRLKYLHENADKYSPQEALAALEKNPDSADDLYVLGLVYLNEHRDRDAGEVFGRILSVDSGYTGAKWGRAEVERRQHNYKEAQALLDEVIAEEPDFAPAYITLAYIRYIQMDFKEAVRAANKVLRIGEGHVDTSNYARAHLIASGTRGMIAHYGGPISKLINGTQVLPGIKQAQSLQPDSAGVFFGLGSFYLLAPKLAGGDLNEAEANLKKAIERDPLLADAYVRLAQLYKIKGDSEKYSFFLDKALEIDPKNELALDTKSGECRFICTGGKD